MPRRWFPIVLLGALALLQFNWASAIAQTSGAAGQTGPGTVPLASGAAGARVTAVEVQLRRSGGNATRDEALSSVLRSSLSPLVGRGFSQVEVERRLAPLRARMGTGSIGWRLLGDGPDGSVILRVDLDTSLADLPPDAATGLLSDAGEGFPVLWRDSRSLLMSPVSGGFGLYSDGNPWFGQPSLFNNRNPLARQLPGGRATWTEGYVEAGLAGATQQGFLPLYLFGEFSVLSSWSLGQDIFRDDPRSVTGIERAYAGFTWVEPDTGHSLTLSAGRQVFTLNDGFLINQVKGSTNAGGRAALYLGPRLRNEFSTILHAKADDWTFQAFYIDPDEITAVDSRTTFLGANLKRDITDRFSLDASFITIPQSNSNLANPQGLKLSREGIRTVAAHALWREALAVPGFWLEGEVAHQSSDEFDMSAWAGYGLIGYHARELPWRPSLSYRYAEFSGDDPSTRRYERFDSLLSTGLGIWLQGINFGKLTSNSNLVTHRVQFNVAPRPDLNVTFDYHLLRAAETQNAGGNPALATLRSSDLGQEFSLSARWSLTRQLYLQCVASIALPGKALSDIGADRPWTTLQASLYWTL